MRRLLKHTAGLGNYLESIAPGDLSHAATVADLCELIRDEPVTAAHAYRYSNSGYLVLGAAIEAVAERSYYDEVRARVFEPLSMNATGHGSLDRVVPDLATGYSIGSDGERRSNARLLLAHSAFDAPSGGPAGGGYSTIDDLGRFARALLDEDVDGAGVLLRGLLDAVPADAPEERYGYGLIETLTEGCQSFGHTGGYTGINAAFEVFPEQRLVFVLLANRDGAVDLVVPRVREMVARGAIEVK